jgi:hypothetical protein
MEELLQEYKKLQSDFMRYEFDFGDDRYKRLVDIERILIKNGSIKPIWDEKEDR